MSMSAVRKRYSVPAKRGMRVRVYNGRLGRITSTYGDNLRIRLDERRHPGIYHPTWRITYLGNDGTVLAEYSD